MPEQTRLVRPLPDGRIPVVVSGDTPELRSESAAAIASWLRGRTDVGAAEVAAQLLTARPVRRHRAIIACTGRDDLLPALDAVASGTPHAAAVQASAAAHRIGYVYPGQGSQRPGMGALDYAASAPYRTAVDECHDASLALFGTSPRDYVLGELTDPTREDDVRVVQPALFMHMIGLTAMWDAAGVAPAAVIGHSQGEIAAAVRSGVMSLNDGIVVVTVRARLVHQLSPTGYTMAVLGVDRDRCEDLLARNSGWAELSVVNSAHVLCISGHTDTVQGIVADLLAEGAFAKEIRVAYPAHTSVVSRFHTEFIDGTAGALEAEHFATGELPCIGGTLGATVDESMALGDYWFWNLRNRVRFDLAIDSAVDAGVDTFVELAEHPTLALAVSETLSAHAAPTTVVGTRRRDCTDLTLFTRNVMSVAAADLSFDYRAWVPTANGPRPLPLEGFPTTRMRRTRLWASRLAGRDDPVNAADWAAPRPERDVRTLHVQWVRPERRRTAPPAAFAVLDPTGRCGALADALCAEAAGQGATAYAPGVQAGPVDAGVVLVPPCDGDDVPAQLSRVLADARWRHGLGDLPQTLWIVTCGGETVVDGDRADPVGAAAAAALRCASAEYPGITVGHLDLPGDADPAAVAAQVIGALHVTGEPELALRGGVVHVKRLVEAADESAVVDHDLTHVLITGGTGQLGRRFAERFAAQGAQRITLLSRSGGDATARADIEATRRRHRTRVDVVECDLTDPASVAAAAAATGGATLVIHAALGYADAPLDAIDPETLRASLDAKVSGLDRLLGSLTDQGSPAPEVLICSSLAATLGGRDQALYAAGNRLTEIAAADLRARGVRASALAWGLWQVQGPLDERGVARVTATGVVPMAPDAALDAGLAVRGTDAVVMAARWPEFRELLAFTGHQPLIERVADRSAAEPASAPTAHVQTAAAEPQPEPEPAPEPNSESPAPSGDLRTAITAELAATMGLGVGDIDPTIPLVSLGLDSLQALDFRKRVQAGLGRDLPVEAILGGASLADAVDLIA